MSIQHKYPVYDFGELANFKRERAVQPNLRTDFSSHKTQHPNDLHKCQDGNLQNHHNVNLLNLQRVLNAQKLAF